MTRIRDTVCASLPVFIMECAIGIAHGPSAMAHAALKSSMQHVPFHAHAGIAHAGIAVHENWIVALIIAL